MTVTVANFAAELGVSNARLLEQLKAAGIPKHTAEDVVTEEDKHRLLASLRSAHGEEGGELRRITLNRTSTTEIKQSVGAGKSRTVQVEVRRKRTYVKREALLEDVAEAALLESSPAREPVHQTAAEPAQGLETTAAAVATDTEVRTPPRATSGEPHGPAAAPDVAAETETVVQEPVITKTPPSSEPVARKKKTIKNK